MSDLVGSGTPEQPDAEQQNIIAGCILRFIDDFVPLSVRYKVAREIIAGLSSAGFRIVEEAETTEIEYGIWAEHFGDYVDHGGMGEWTQARAERAAMEWRVKDHQSRPQVVSRTVCCGPWRPVPDEKETQHG